MTRRTARSVLLLLLPVLHADAWAGETREILIHRDETLAVRIIVDKTLTGEQEYATREEAFDGVVTERKCFRECCYIEPGATVRVKIDGASRRKKKGLPGYIRFELLSVELTDGSKPDHEWGFGCLVGKDRRDDPSSLFGLKKNKGGDATIKKTRKKKGKKEEPPIVFRLLEVGEPTKQCEVVAELESAAEDGAEPKEDRKEDPGDPPSEFTPLRIAADACKAKPAEASDE